MSDRQIMFKNGRSTIDTINAIVKLVEMARQRRVRFFFGDIKTIVFKMLYGVCKVF